MAKRVKVSHTRDKRGKTKSLPRLEDQDLLGERTGMCCDICNYESDKNIPAKGFCQQCDIFICKPCTDQHKKTPVWMDHVVLQGANMPKCPVDRCTKYADCHLHEAQVNDCYCLDHRRMICRACAKDNHQNCTTQYVPILCKLFCPADINRLKDTIHTNKQTVASVRSILEENINEVEKCRIKMVKKAEELRTDLIEKINKSCSGTIESINNICQGKCSEIKDNVSKISDILSKSDQTCVDIDDIVHGGNKISPSDFLKVQDIIKDTRKRSKQLIKQFKKTELLFCQTSENSSFIVWCKRLGTVKEVKEDLDKSKDLPDISFPELINSEPFTRKQGDISTILPERITAFSPRSVEDEQTCDIVAMAVTSTGSLIILDNKNEAVKILSEDNKVLSKVHIPAKLNLVTVANDMKAVVYTTEMKGKGVFNNTHLHFINILDESSIYIEATIPCTFVSGMVSYKNYLILSSGSYPSGVKMIDYSDPELTNIAASSPIWNEQAAHNNMLFKFPGIINKQFSTGRSSVVVADWGKCTIVALAADNGNHINTGTVSGNTHTNIISLTADDNGNVYGLLSNTKGIRVWSPDLQDSKSFPLPSTNTSPPKSIVYNDITEELFISYPDSDFIDRFRI